MSEQWVLQFEINIKHPCGYSGLGGQEVKVQLLLLASYLRVCFFVFNLSLNTSLLE